MKKQNIIGTICLILIITFISLYPSLKNNFVNWDDPDYVTGNFQIRDLSLQNVKNIFTSSTSGGYSPLVVLSYAIEYHFFRLNPAIYHFTNLFLHLLNCVLVFWLFFLLSDKISVSLIVSLLFGIHPLHVESVAWVTARKDLFCAAFYLSSLICYLYYVKKGRAKYYYFSILLFALSFLSKAMAVTLPLILFLFDYFLVRKFNRNTLIEKIPFIGAAVIVSILTIAAFKFPQVSGFLKTKFSVIDRVFFASYVPVFHFVKTIIPLKLSVIYPYPDKAGNFLPFIYYISPLIIAGLFAAVYNSKKYTAKIIFGSSFFIIAILPVIQFVPFTRSITNDRFNYIPSLGLFYIMAEGFYRLYSKKIKHFLSGVLVVTICLFSFLTWNKCKEWKNSVTLWNNVLKTYPYYPDAYYNRGNAYYFTGKYEEAVADFNQAIKNNPDYAEAYNNRANIYFDLKEYDKAFSDSNRAIEINPDYAEAYNNRGNVYSIMKEYDKALMDYNRAIEINPDYSDAYYNRGIVYSIKKEYDNTLLDYDRIIKINPNYADADFYYNRGNVYFNLKKYNEAADDFKKAVKLDKRYEAR